MTILDSLILGIVEGITEFLPVSSTGHLILAAQLLRIPSSDFLKSFEIAIQLGAILAVIIIYRRSFLDFPLMKKVAIGFVPTGIIGLVLYKFAKAHLIGNQSVVLWALAVGGAALIAFELWQKRREKATAAPAEEAATDEGVSAISYKQAIGVGLFQSLAIIPGVSRSAASILGGMLIGLRRRAIVEFSFLLAVPTMLAATGLDLIKNASMFSADQFWALAVGFVASFVVGWASIRLLLAYVRSHTFIPFGIYRIAVALLFWAVILR